MVVEVDDDERVELVDMLDNDAYHPADNEHSSEVDNNF